MTTETTQTTSVLQINFCYFSQERTAELIDEIQGTMRGIGTTNTGTAQMEGQDRLTIVRQHNKKGSEFLTDAFQRVNAFCKEQGITPLNRFTLHSTPAAIPGIEADNNSRLIVLSPNTEPK